MSAPHEERLKDKPTGYAGYLDKEMTIMGVLSAFAISAGAAVLWKTSEAKADTLLARVVGHAPALTLGGAFLALGAALLFYRQRSLLAYFYGQIQLASEFPAVTTETVERLVRQADSWATWVYYRWGFAFLSLAFAGWAAALVLAYVHVSERGWPTISWAATALIVGVGMARLTHILRAHRYEEDPLSPFWHSFLTK